MLYAASIALFDVRIVVAMMRDTLESRFTARNGLNLFRIILATGVIFTHSYPLTGDVIGSAPLRQFAGSFSVDGFFAISGFLITMSWMRRPDWRDYLRSRTLRIFPGFYVCLLATVLVLAPLGILVGAGTWPSGYPDSGVTYLLKNSLLYIGQLKIAGTPDAVPYPEAWNGSLWTLFWEFLCYLAVLALGMLGLLRKRSFMVAAFVAMLVLVGIVIVLHIDSWWVTNTARFGTMFLAGCLVFLFRSRIPVRLPLVLGAFAIVAASMLLPDYRVVGALPFAYGLICASTYVTSPRLEFRRNDWSYGVYIYAFPVQQILAGTSIGDLPPLIFGVVAFLATLPLAAGSWYLIERPALKLRHRRSTARHVGMNPSESRAVRGPSR
ncbi:acyltransferase family protein [Nocardioides sp. Kera G14]|uniref:acyltransferase family protein n=1 Tax=Nocardioides sp. Kera G14 TaxID=2884264 RepID=UPI001D107D7A|nr:acyltransferase [Nocardioides sp. Kera G14]UDY23113.1 acyltransferase [Nocardioides sp. Kera G14]